MVTVYSNHDKKINKEFTVIMLQQDNFLILIYTASWGHIYMDWAAACVPAIARWSRGGGGPSPPL